MKKLKIQKRKKIKKKIIFFKILKIADEKTNRSELLLNTQREIHL